MELTYSTFIVIFIFLSQQDSFMGRLVDFGDLNLICQLVSFAALKNFKKWSWTEIFFFSVLFFFNLLNEIQKFLASRGFLNVRIFDSSRGFFT